MVRVGGNYMSAEKVMAVKKMIGEGASVIAIDRESSPKLTLPGEWATIIGNVFSVGELRIELVEEAIELINALSFKLGYTNRAGLPGNLTVYVGVPSVEGRKYLADMSLLRIDKATE